MRHETWVAVFFLAVTTTAQTQFDIPQEKRHFPLPGGPGVHLIASDLDADGDLDLLICTRSSVSAFPIRIFRNLGKTRFEEATAQIIQPIVTRASAVAVGDLDGDGDLDLIFARGDSQGTHNGLAFNKGTGQYVDASANLPVTSARSWSVAVGDVDGDGDLDAVFGNMKTTDQLYLNDGTGHFSISSSLPADQDSTHTVKLIDVDGDKDLDLIRGTRFNGITLYTNNGGGTFTVDTGAIPAAQTYSFCLGIVDVDGDGDTDLVEHSDRPRLFRNDGTGKFTDISTTHMPSALIRASAVAVAVADVDRDGDLDLLWTLDSPQEQHSRLYQNDGTGKYTDVTASRIPATPGDHSAVVLADFDGDGDCDAAMASEGGNHDLLLNDGTGNFLLATPRTIPIPLLGDTGGSPLVILSGDFDQDGDIDFVDGRYDSSNAMYESVDAVHYRRVPTSRFPDHRNDTHALVAGDVNGDGLVDLILANAPDFSHFPGQNLLYLGIPGGGFADATSGRMPYDHQASRSLAMADVDMDGDLDLVFGNYELTFYGLSGQALLYRNDGTGTFLNDTVVSLPADSQTVEDLRFADIDGDGDEDLLLTGNRPRLWINAGNGIFTDSTATQMPSGPFAQQTSIAVGDVDGDGDIDAVFGTNGIDFLLRNDGTGVFADATTAMPGIDTYTTNDIALHDIDEDGDLDIVVCSTKGLLLFLNDGSGRFVDASGSRLPAGLLTCSAMAAFDLDSDGDIDLLHDKGALINRHRDFAIPYIPRVGGTLQMEFLAAPGYGTQSLYGLPMVSPTRLARPLEFLGIGKLYLTPSHLVAAPWALVPAGAGTATVTVPVPVITNLIGNDIHIQAILLDLSPGGNLHFTTVRTETILN